MTTLVATNPPRKLDLKWRVTAIILRPMFCTGLTFSVCSVAFQDQINIETKIKNIRFIGELCKFKMAPPALVFSCLKVCVYETQN
jgi:hypothetical protein